MRRCARLLAVAALLSGLAACGGAQQADSAAVSSPSPSPSPSAGSSPTPTASPPPAAKALGINVGTPPGPDDPLGETVGAFVKQFLDSWWAGDATLMERFAAPEALAQFPPNADGWAGYVLTPGPGTCPDVTGAALCYFGLLCDQDNVATVLASVEVDVIDPFYIESFQLFGGTLVPSAEACLPLQAR